MDGAGINGGSAGVDRADGDLKSTSGERGQKLYHDSTAISNPHLLPLPHNLQIYQSRSVLKPYLGAEFPLVPNSWRAPEDAIDQYPT